MESLEPQHDPDEHQSDYEKAILRLAEISARFTKRYMFLLRGNDPALVEAFTQFALIEVSELLRPNRGLQTLADLRCMTRTAIELMRWPEEDVRRYFALYVENHHTDQVAPVVMWGSAEMSYAPVFSLN